MVSIEEVEIKEVRLEAVIVDCDEDEMLCVACCKVWVTKGWFQYEIKPGSDDGRRRKDGSESV